MKLIFENFKLKMNEEAKEIIELVDRIEGERVEEQPVRRTRTINIRETPLRVCAVMLVLTYFILEKLIGF